MKTISNSTVTLWGSIHFMLFLLFLYLMLFGSGRCYAETKSLKYLGNAFVKIKTNSGKVIYIDPYAVNESDSADIVLITHEHSDHNDLTRVNQKISCKLIRVSDAIKNDIYQNFTIGNVKISSVPAYNKYHAKADGVGFVLEFDGIKVYHSGGTGKITEMADLANQKIDYALFPITPGPEEMTQAAALVQARYDIPIHSKVSSDRTEDQSLNAKFASPHKLVIPVDQTIPLLTVSQLMGNRILYVPQYYSTIQSAINTANSGDTILVSEGTYYENINYKGKGIVVTSNFYITKDWSSVQKTIVDGSKCANKDTASTVLFLNKEDSTAVLDGFTITGGTGTKYLFPNGTGSSKFQEGGGIVLHYSSAVIKNNIIVNNATKPQAGTTDGGGGGIATMYGNPTIVNNVIVNNIAGYAGGIVLNWSGGKVRNNIVYHNRLSSPTYGCGGVMVWQAPKNSAFIENNTIVGNISLKDGGGITISLASGAIPTLKNNIIWGNRQASGGQVVLPQYLSNNDVEDFMSPINISVNPLFVDGTFQLADNSPCIDAGDQENKFNDLIDLSNGAKVIFPSRGSSKNDIGAFGGPFAKVLASLNVADVYTPSSSLNPSGSVDKEGIFKINLLNTSSGKLTIDSVCASNKSIFSIPKSCNGKVMNMFGMDTLTISYKPKVGGTLKDTIKIYFKAGGKSGMLKIPFIANITGVETNNLLPSEYKLYQNYPNPFNPSTQIKFSISKREHVRIKLLDILGREVETLVNDEMEAGLHNVSWEPQRSMASGVYLVNLIAGNFIATNKVIFQK